MKYTREHLEDLPRKADVIAIAQELGLDTDGTRAEITNRILDNQTVEEAGPVEEVAAEAPVEVAAEAPVEEAVAGEPVKLVKLSLTPKALEWGVKVLKSYLGADIDNDTVNELRDGLEAGYQPCIVSAGKKKFALEVREAHFNPYDFSRDVPSVEVVLNIARRMCSVGLYPHI